MGWGESEYTVVGDSKILTVSYGTFSCTLEGFDEPFSTMKAISEYFRDLAERDRFFGAEPPQPDAEYLHRIAEQTIKSRVNAEVTDNSLILRQDHQQQDTAPIAAPAVAAAPVDAPAQPVADAAAPVAAPETAVAAFVETPTSDRTGFGEGDTIAEKLQRIRAVVSRETAEPAEVTSFYSEDEHAEDLAAPEAEPEAVTDPGADLDADDTAEAEVPTPVAQDVYEDDDGTADVLSSIMANAAEDEVDADVDAPVAETATDDAETEDEVEMEAEADVEAGADVDVVADIETAADELDEADQATAAEDVAATEEEADQDAPTDEVVADAEADAPAEAIEASSEADTDGDTDASADIADVMAPIAKPRRRIIVQKISRAEVEAASTAAETDDTAEDASAELDDEAEAALMAELAEVEADMGEDIVSDEEDDMEARALASAQAAQDKADAEAAERARVEAEAAAAAAADAQADAEAKAAEEADALAKVMAEAAEVEAEQGEDVGEDATDAVAAEAAEEDAATAEVEADDADTDADHAEASTAPEAETTQDENRAARLARRALLVEDEDAALNRLMDATSTRLSDDDEGAVRRASIAHLKAAVAATKADDSIAKAAADEEERELDQYRDDLARVVRPGRARPRAEGAATSRPAPLVLVSEQRIDAPAPQADAAAAADVRPRRITAGNLALKEEMEEELDENLFDDANVESFSQYAARHDALELPDLLEAAAAHYAFIEGAEEFTRPMLMRKIASLTTGEAPSREAGLRSFGALLREGRVVKSGNGKFVLSGKSRFTPEAREAGE